MRKIQTTKQFDRDYKKILKSGNKDLRKLQSIMRQLVNCEILDSKFKDHKLIAPDIILFERTGSHSELFK